jgi:hypothetical protein
MTPKQIPMKSIYPITRMAPRIIHSLGLITKIGFILTFVIFNALAADKYSPRELAEIFVDAAYDTNLPEGHGRRLKKWDRPINIVAMGASAKQYSQSIKRLVDQIASASGHEISFRLGGSGNFILAFSDDTLKDALGPLLPLFSMTYANKSDVKTQTKNLFTNFPKCEGRSAVHGDSIRFSIFLLKNGMSTLETNACLSISIIKQVGLINITSKNVKHFIYKDSNGLLFTELGEKMIKLLYAKELHPGIEKSVAFKKVERMILDGEY